MDGDHTVTATFTQDEYATIYGTVFKDSNSNQVQDEGEAGIAGVTITLDGVITASTDISGSYVLSTGVAGPHTVIETDPADYSSTTPNTVTLSVELNHSYIVNFGDIPTDQANPCFCLADSYEDDNAVARATDLSVDVRQTHNFCDDSTDWIAFTAKAGDTYTITTSSWGQRADTFLALFGADGHTLLAANDDYDGTKDYSSRIVWQAPTDGVYYVRITNRAGLTGCNTDYDVWIERREMAYIYLPMVARNHNGGTIAAHKSDATLSPTGVITHTCPDAYEVDDTWQQAHAIEEGVGQVHSFDSDPTLYAADKDFVWFDVSGGRTVTFTIAPVTNTQTLMELHDEHGAVLNMTGTTQLVWTPTAGGHYYLSVRPEDGTASFGCADAAGYRLLLEMQEINILYLPMITRNF